MIEILLPGEPCAQARSGKVIRKNTAGVPYVHQYDPAKSKNWKAAAAWTIRAQMRDRQPFTGPVAIHVTAYFTCPKSDHRKTVPCPSRWHAKRPDLDNICKAIFDSAKGILWFDDAQVASLVMTKRIAAQGIVPGIVLCVRALEP